MTGHLTCKRHELHHPVRLAFVPTSTIALLLLATAGQDIAPGLAAVLWWVGTARSASSG